MHSHFIRGNAVAFSPPNPSHHCRRQGQEEIAARLAEDKVLKSSVAETRCCPAHSTDWAPQPAAGAPM